MVDYKEAKKALRKEIKERTAMLDADYCKKADKVICEKILALPQYQAAKTVFAFVNAFGEPNTVPVIEDCWKQGKKICVPRCIDDHTMLVYEIKNMEDLESGAYGILEPKPICKLVEADDIDFALIPCVTCDEEGNRLGHGRGYYDRYLENAKFFSCMICRRQLMSNNIPVDELDVKPNLVISD